MLNKYGQTPLDICIEDADMNLEKTIEPDGLLSHRNESDLEKGGSLKPKESKDLHRPRNRRGKVVDESQT